MNDNEQTQEEKNAEYEIRAEKEFAEIAAIPTQVDWAKIRAIKVKEYVQSISHTFHTCTELGTTTGVFMFEGTPYLATYYQTVEDIANDGWSLDIATVEFVGSTDCVMEATESGWVMRVEEYNEDDYADE